MSKEPTVHIGLLQSMLDGPLHHGVDIDNILIQHGVDLSALDPKHGRISKEQFGLIQREIWTAMNDEATGFLSKPLQQGYFAMKCHSTITCPNLRRVILRGIRFCGIVTDDLTYTLTEQGEEAILRFHYRNPRDLDPLFFVTSMMIIWVRWCSWMIDRPILLDRINFSFPAPEFADEFEYMFACRHYFDQAETSVVFNRRFLERPVVQDPQSLSEFLANAPECLLSRYRSDNSLTAKIRSMLHTSDSVENLPFEVVADRLHMTTQTLRRRLKEEGNAYQEIKDSVRRDTATYHLARLNTPINDIAIIMGFSEPSAFNRAFKKWTGMTPGAYRDSVA